MKHKHTGGYPLDLYAYDSRLRELNPRFKVIFAITILVFCIAADNIGVSLLIIITMAYLTVWKGGLKLNLYLSSLMIPLTFMVVGSLAIAVGIAKEPVEGYGINFHVLYVYITADSVEKAVKILLKAFGAVSAMYMMVLSTPASDIISVLRRLHLPKLVIELMNMIYRFIFILMEVQCKLKNSAEARLGYRDFRTACRSFGNSAGNLLVLSWKKANAYYDALVSRCYDGDLQFLEEEKEVTVSQAMWALAYLGLLTAVKAFTG